MTVRNFRPFGALSLAVAAAALVLPPASLAAAAPRVHTVVIDKMKFGPAPAGLRTGDTILWINRDMFKHTATARDQSFNVDLPPNSSRKIVIKRPGIIAYYCVYHPGMKGALNVAK